MYITLQDLAIIPLACCVAEHDHNWGTGVAGAGANWSCPHAHSR